MKAVDGVQPWWNRIPAILKYPFSVGGVIALATMTFAAILQALSRFGPAGIIGRLIASGLVFAIIFLVIRHSARGSQEFPSLSEIEDPFDDVIAPGIKVTVLGLVLYGPALFCVFNGFFAAANAGSAAMMRVATTSPLEQPRGDESEWEEEDGAPAWMAAPAMPGAKPAKTPRPRFDAEEKEILAGAAKAAGWFLLAGVLAVAVTLVYPLCLMILAMSGSLLASLYPIAWFAILRQVPLGYLGLLAALGAGTGISFFVGVPLSFVPIPFFGTIAGSIAKMYLTLCGAHLLGWFIFQNRDRLGLGGEVERRDVSIAEVKAMALQGQGSGQTYRPSVAGVVRVGTTPLAAPGPLAAGEVAGGPPAAAAPEPPWGAPASEPQPGSDEIAGLHARFQAACASRDAAAIAQSAPLLVDTYWQAGNALGATQVFRAVMASAPETSLGPERLARLAKDLEQQESDLQGAMTAWRTLALQHPDHPRAPSSLWRCAEICVKMQRPDWVASACQAILARYPMSEVAPLAQQRLKQLSPKP